MPFTEHHFPMALVILTTIKINAMTNTSIYRNPRTKTTEQFIIDAKKIHGDKYDYSLVEYEKAIIKVKIICTIHGIFEQSPNDHLSGHGCSKCFGDNQRILKQSNKEEFITKANLIHDNKYDYSLVDYKHSKSKVKIICSIHDVFEQIPKGHLSGHGCPKCKADKTRILNTQKWCDKYDTGTLYLLRCYNDIEEFLKIGITSKTIEERYNGKDAMPYDYEILYEFNGNSKVVSDLEQYIKSNFDYYKPQIWFCGATTETLHISQHHQILEYINSQLLV